MQSSISPDDPAMIQFTSGTTGQPKATSLSHFGMINNSYNIGNRALINKENVKLCAPLPLFHVGGCIISLLGCLHFGSTMVLPGPHFNAEDTLRAFVDEKCNQFSGTPTFFIDMIAKQRELKLNLPQIDIATCGGALLSPQVVKDIESVLKVKKIASVYGLTETSSAIFQSLPEDDSSSVEEFVGKILEHTEAKVIDKNGNTVPFGTSGELCIRSSCNMLEYWGDEEKTKEILGNDRWLKTGDQFILYENGYGKICGRLKEMIIRGGENIFPKEIEDFLSSHEKIREAYIVSHLFF
jgi:fatty-acyl-CoA synthase